VNAYDLLHEIEYGGETASSLRRQNRKKGRGYGDRRDSL
jgi:hypothetical protein